MPRWKPPPARQFNVRIPDELRARLEAAAEKNRRSLTWETILRLERSFEEDQHEPVPR